MPSLRQAFRDWVSQRNAQGMILLLSKSSNPQATLQAYRRSINDDVIKDYADLRFLCCAPRRT